MYTIAVCDNIDVMAQENARLTREIMMENGFHEDRDYALSVFYSIQELTKAMSRKVFDLLLLDIEFDGENGIQTMQRLRHSHISCGVIYITAYEKYVYDSFSTRPIQYLLKPVDRNRLSDAILEDYRQLNKPRAMQLSVKREYVTVIYEDILYLEAQGHNTNIRMKNRIIRWYGMLRELEDRLPSEDFSRCHRSFIVNINHILQTRPSYLILDIGERIPVGRNYHDLFYAQFLQGMST